MGLKIRNYGTEPELYEAIDRYFTLLRLTFDLTGIYKVFETCCSQIYQSVSQAVIPQIPAPRNVKPKLAHANFICPKCSTQYKIQLNFEKNVNITPGAVPYPKNDNFVCPNCNTQTNLSPMRLQLEAQTGLKVTL
jgi:Zn ribbon nucleic-acid-binding protein